MPSLTDPSIAPEGCESFYVLSLVPDLASGTDWGAMAKPYRDRIMQFLEDNYLPDLQANIIAEHFIDPRHFQNTLNSYRGAAFSVKPTSSSRPGCGRTAAPRTWTTSTSSAPARIRARACPRCWHRARSPPN
jgi:phytoene dehydrogenase-like protein